MRFHAALSPRQPAGRASGRGPSDSGRERACRRLDCARPPAASACRRRRLTGISPTRRIFSLPSPPRVSTSSPRRCRARPGAPIPSPGRAWPISSSPTRTAASFASCSGPFSPSGRNIRRFRRRARGVEAMLVRGVADIDQRPLNDNHRGDGGVGPRARARASDRRRLLSGGASHGSRRRRSWPKSDCRDRRFRSSPDKADHGAPRRALPRSTGART